MVDMQEIENEIRRVEGMETNYSNCTKLAVLYTIYDRFAGKPTERHTDYYSGASSEFLNAVYNAPIDKVLLILDEHLTAINALYPREYRAIINKIKDI